MDKTYNKRNFHKHTFCIFKEVEPIEIEGRNPDFISKSGSSYYFTETGVYRLSNHWGRAANCKWRLQSKIGNPSRTKIGFAFWTAFHTDNDSEKLYFIRVDFENHTATYEHKDNAPPLNALLRTVSETTKILKQIRNLFDSESWSSHLEGDIEMLRKKIIGKLITTNEPLAEIKRSL
jgi:hypothetical protein